jgi:type IV pilus assembly protein PilA
MTHQTMSNQAKNTSINNLARHQRFGASSLVHMRHSKGFTLVELMVVIVIVGILSAIALPNFLSQSDKAKSTEAKTISSAYLKQIFAAYQEGGSTADGSTDGTGSIPCPSTTKYFSYGCTPDGTTLNQITATGLAASGSLSGKTVTSNINLLTGGVTIGNPTAPAAP